MGFPRIPGAPLPDHMLNPLLDYDFGPDFRAHDLSGRISTQPPVIRQVLPSLVPRADADGNAHAWGNLGFSRDAEFARDITTCASKAFFACCVNCQFASLA